jgi:enoyl reductase-like protein
MQLILEEDGITKVYVFTAYGTNLVLTSYSESHIPKGKKKKVRTNHWRMITNITFPTTSVDTNMQEPILTEHIKKMAKDQYFKEVEFMTFNQFTNR